MTLFWRLMNRIDTAMGHRCKWFCNWAWDHDEDWLASLSEVNATASYVPLEDFLRGHPQ